MTQGNQLNLFKGISNMPKYSPIKGLGGALGPGLMLLQSWYGKDKYGAVGPGRAVYESFLPPSKEEMDRYKEGYDKTLEFINNMFGSNKQDNKSNVKLEPLPELDNIPPINQTLPVERLQQIPAMPKQTDINSIPKVMKQMPKRDITDVQLTPEQGEAINNYISQLQNINQPYIDALQNYSSNYDDLVRRNFNAQRYFTAMAGLSGNQGYTRLADALNPIANEANKLNTLKLVRDAQAGDINAINEIMGNLAMAQEMGLPPEAAFANKNLLTMMASKDREANRYQIALENNLMKKYGIDRNYARALAVQQMRGETARDIANINAMAYGYGGQYQPAPGLNTHGQVVNQQQPTASAADMYKNIIGR